MTIHLSPAGLISGQGSAGDGKGGDGGGKVTKARRELVADAVVRDGVDTMDAAEAEAETFLSEDCAVVIVEIHVKVLSPGISFLLLGSSGFVIEGALVTAAIVADLLANADSFAKEASMLKYVVIRDAVARNNWVWDGSVADAMVMGLAGPIVFRHIL